MAGFIQERLQGWFNPTLEQRLEAARKDKLAERIEVYKADYAGSFMCNLCRETKKNCLGGTRDSDSGYTTLYFCTDCMRRIQALW